jgi:hypothetical protein
MDLFDHDVAAARQKGREAFRRLVGRYPMTREEKQNLRDEARANAEPRQERNR